jgi:SAM-dependent methyltransferase
MTRRILAILKDGYKRIAAPCGRGSSTKEMTVEDESFLLKNLNFRDMTCVENMKMMSGFSARSREVFARRTGSLVLYMPKEAETIKRLEEEAALQAAPIGHELKQLNGLNVGCGDRRISDYLTPIDIMRESEEAASSGAHHAFLPGSILANPEDLPFKHGSIDFIVALHMLEHVSNPMEILLYWGTLLKPGGGIGLILPISEYTWDATGDHSQYGHKWNTSAEIFKRLFNTYLKDYFELERIDTLPYKISFNVVLRKPGKFQPFSISNMTSLYSGAELAKRGAMVSEFGA